MHDLIERLEKSERGSRELDWVIAERLGWTYVPPAPALLMGPSYLDPNGDDAPLPHYTTSLSAALPDEDIVAVQRHSDGTWWARDYRQPEDFGAVGHTEALARRAAALRARAGE